MKSSSSEESSKSLLTLSDNDHWLFLIKILNKNLIEIYILSYSDQIDEQNWQEKNLTIATKNRIR